MKTLDFKTMADFIGNTPLVALQRMQGEMSNTILLKLEGNNPAGSVKDRAAYSMISHAEARGDIEPGDTLIEATSGNTGIALAMVAAMRGYKLVLVMPENQSVERRQSMKAYGAELVLTPKDGSMELARDVALKLQAEGEGIVLEYSINSGGSWVEFGRYNTTNYWAWTYLSVNIPAAAQTGNTLFRWRQLSNSGASFDHWALDDVSILTGPQPPVIMGQPANQIAVVGGTSTWRTRIR